MNTDSGTRKRYRVAIDCDDKKEHSAENDSSEGQSRKLSLINAHSIQISLHNDDDVDDSSSHYKHQNQSNNTSHADYYDVDGPSSSSSTSSAPLMAIFLPPRLTDELLKTSTTKTIMQKDLTTKVHASLANTIKVQFVIRSSSSSSSSAPADVWILLVQKLDQVLYKLNSERPILREPYSYAVLVGLPVSNVSFGSDLYKKTSPGAGTETGTGAIPACPVCLHRIEPERLGLPKLPPHSLCSPCCVLGESSSTGTSTSTSTSTSPATVCSNQQLLQPWPEPSYCKACHCIQQSASSTTPLFHCYKCGMSQTLWVCLTCGEVGCGRYSKAHSLDHFQESGHPYSLELVTHKIWDYNVGETGGFVHRPDLLNCPWLLRTKQQQQQQQQQPLGRWEGVGEMMRLLIEEQEEASSSSIEVDWSTRQELHHRRMQAICNAGRYGLMTEDDAAVKSPKKATMIGEEYEALLQSALQDQAQHYESEITRLRASLTAERVDQNQMTREEKEQIEGLGNDIRRLRSEQEKLEQKLLEGQAQEAGYRAQSQRLLREQAVARDLLDKIRQEAAKEHEEGRLQVEELEQQVADLTGNLKMRHQIAMDEELCKAQIFGTTNNNNNSKSKKGWKKSRAFRK